MSRDEERVQLDREEAIAWVIATTRCRRPFARKTVDEAQRGQTPYGLRYEGGHWTIRAIDQRNDEVTA